jgi:hypothetical protein
MVFLTEIDNQLTTEEQFVMTGQPFFQRLDPVVPYPDSCRAQIDGIVHDIQDPVVREIVGRVFGDLLRLLECLSLTQGHLRQIDLAEETLAVFQIIHDEARALVMFIREDAVPCEAISENLSETLDGISFAVSHDLQSVFETRELVNIEEPKGQMVGKLFRAHDLLTNCLQQSIISLAIMFDPKLVGTKLFNNSDMRYRQSVQLCADLSTLLKLGEACRELPLEPAFSNLIAGLERFRNESMESLMYSDWPQFEAFCERLRLAPVSSWELAPLLHQFCCYLETLLGQVQMRAVLANVFPIQCAVDHTDQLSSFAHNASAQFSAPIDFKNDDFSWDAFAIAV